MSIGRLPGIKGLVSGSQDRRRFKSELSVDMISPPMGDFRHTMHVGRGGDVFGDTSFLSNYGGVREPGSPDSANSSKSMGFFTRTFRHIRKNSGPRGELRDLSSPPPDISPIIKNAVSLPQLNSDSPNGCLQRVMLPSSISSTDSAICTYGIQSGFVTLPRFSRLDRPFLDGEHRVSRRERHGKAVARSDSLTSFTLDLGPSLLSEVLGFFDNPTFLQVPGRVAAAEEEEKGDDDDEEEDERSLTETFVSPAVSSTNSSLRSGSSRRNVNGKEDSCSSSWTEEDRGTVVESSKSPARSPPKQEPAMESERFQKAADVLSRHYGGGSVKRMSPPLSKTSYPFSEEEEEIKV
ncbi:cdc42 effector protein 1b [Syngnathoides biaculeatus]|uniref:cdc42 effector protein 1b n=1 Tax=Syngnathoides biaculeatus TaxID=300417 RepID=UPI002ADDA399|nr:cdc42 effector protein 1b [Syngnathoides biaculeatus]XP_061702173.1 cdc42 effector protein 1b [Syngnathoides biaculeatus]XP_061702174.1 cdc42 effector protein 1b [Syngnathoides biaculeatus]XP_061702175.1 cdc42 effector protein 1b [Syngnathoides biaculeatus]XP_061702176.1 cdc42 effector protein 1b [Syngnathoides biaculeatus]